MNPFRGRFTIMKFLLLFVVVFITIYKFFPSILSKLQTASNKLPGGNSTPVA